MICIINIVENKLHIFKTIMSIFIVIFIILLSIYAFIFEKNEASDALVKGIPDKKDNINKLYRKLEWCSTYETRTVKWRRIISFFLLKVI